MWHELIDLAICIRKSSRNTSIRTHWKYVLNAMTDRWESCGGRAEPVDCWQVKRCRGEVLCGEESSFEHNGEAQTHGEYNVIRFQAAKERLSYSFISKSLLLVLRRNCWAIRWAKRWSTTSGRSLGGLSTTQTWLCTSCSYSFSLATPWPLSHRHRKSQTLPLGEFIGCPCILYTYKFRPVIYLR